MARFFVGQRVRVVGAHGPSGRRVIGMEGVVNELDCIGGTMEPGMVGVTLPVPCPVHDTPDGWCFAPHELEPILPEGHKAGDFANVRDLLDSLSVGAPA